jgi:hypothetical protein
MKLNLETLRAEIQGHLESQGIVVFHGYPRSGEASSLVLWDTERHPDYRMFLAAAKAAGVRLVTLYAREFTGDLIDDALERLEESDLPREEHRAVEMRLREMRGYAGFTCQIELSFDLAPRVYVFDLRTEWFDDLNDLLDRIDEAYEGEGDEEDSGPLGGGYFSKN